MQLPKQDLTDLFVVHGRDWSKRAIALALESKGSSLQNIAEEVGVSEGTLRNVLYRPYPKYESLVAQKIGLSPEVIWPSRYRDDNRLGA